MNQIIKERIKKINAGKVPDGYEKTDAGIIPSEWKTLTLGQLLEFKNGINVDKEKYNSGIKMVSVMDILKDMPILYDNIIGQVDIDEKALENYGVTYGDILFQRSSETFEDAGRSNVYLDENKTATYSGFVIRGKKKAEYNPFFLNEVLKKNSIRQQIIRNAAGSQHINIGQGSLSGIKIYLANKKEQEKIAEILMKWDEAIELQGKYIESLEKKRYSAIQTVFNTSICKNEIRLGDFISEISLRNTINCTNVKSVSNKLGFINQAEQFSKQVASEDMSTYKLVSQGNIAYNPSRINVGSIALYNDANIGIVSPMYVVFSCHNIPPELLLLLLETKRGKYEVESYLAGSVRNSLSFSDLCNIKLIIPNKDDQDRIIDFFGKLNIFLEIQNDKINKLKLQRKTLQQYLLTGIVRV